MDGINSILQRLKDFTRVHAVDYENELLSYDTKRIGIISQVSLYRWLSNIGMNLSNRNIQQIIYSFKKDDGVDVYKLIDGINKASSFNQTLSESPPDCTQELLECGREIKRRRQPIRDILSPFDRQNTGHVSPDNFYRAFSATPTYRVIAKCYAINNEIDYLRLANDVYKVSKSQSAYPVEEIPAATPSFTALAKYIKDRDIDLQIFYSQKDRLNSGKLPYGQFIASLASFGASLSPNQLQEIANSFLEHNSGLCNYNLFIKAVNQYIPPKTVPRFTTRNLNENNTNGVISVGDAPPPQTPESLFEAAKGEIRDRRIDLDLHFSHLKREGFLGDEIPLLKFAKIIQGMKISLQNDEIESIASLFKGSNGIRYKDFIAAARPPNTTITITPNDVIPRLRQHLYDTRQTLARVALRYDRENSGNISASQLSSIIQFVRFDATSQEIAAIREGFPGTEKGTVSWRALCAQVDQPIKPYENSFKDDDSNPSSATLGYSARPQVTSSLPSTVISNILNKIIQATCPSNDNNDVSRASDADFLLPIRQSDKLNRGLIPQQAFINFLYTLPVSFTQSEIRQLISYYRVSGSSDINYLQVSEDAVNLRKNAIEKARTEALQTPLELQPSSPLGTRTLSQLSPEVHDFLRRLKGYCTQRRFQPSSLFERYDTLHNGTVNSYKVQACFAQVDYPVTRKEVETLVGAFSDPRRPDIFNYVLFNRAYDLEDITSSEVRSSLTAAPISFEIDREAEIACIQIREKLLARHRRIETTFYGISTPTCSTDEFKNRLNSIGFVIHASETTALIRKYRVNLSDEIDYNRFCQDVNNSKTI